MHGKYYGDKKILDKYKIFNLKKIDVQLNSCMWIVTGTVKSTPLQWLPVLSNIAHPHLRHRNVLLKEWIKCNSNLSLPIHNFVNSLLNSPRLKSRNPPCKSAIVLHNTNFNVNETWKNEWAASKLDVQKYLKEPTDKPPGHNLPRKEWTTLNRIRTGHGRFGYLMHK